MGSVLNTTFDLKVPAQFDFFASPISYSFCEKYVQLLYVVLVKSSDKLLNYLMFVQTLIEVKMETLKTHEFPP